MRIFITGGTGFIGRHLVKKLQENENSLLLLSQQPLKGINSVEGDLAGMEKWKNKVEEFKPDAAVHLAWEALPDYNSKTSIKNLKYGLDLFNFLAEIGCKAILTTGSCWEYGQQSGKLSEDMALKPLNAFTAAKNALHWLGAEIAKENDIQFIWTRLFYVYGPGQREDSLVPYLINCVRTGQTPEIKNPLAKNDFIYVEDVAEALSLLLKNCKKSGVYNIGLGYPIGVQQIIEMVYKMYNIQPKYQEAGVSEKDLPVDFWADISKIEKAINWKPKVHIEEGISKTIQYYENQNYENQREE